MDLLPQEDVYCLAITLVASVFQLSHTPWLDQKWSKKQIVFLRAGDSHSLAIDIKYPYLLRDFLQGEYILCLYKVLIAAHSTKKVPEPKERATAAIIDNCSSFLTLAIL
jgi:hypothetical protein